MPRGGIAAVFDETDSVDSHVDDTLIAGAGLCDREAVEFIAGNARHCVQWLIDQGVLFDTEASAPTRDRYHLTREGATAIAAFCTPQTPPAERWKPRW